MRTLRELMNSKSEKTRLAAALRASEILMEHTRGEERVAVAIERAAARKAGEQPDIPEAPVSESVDDFIARAKAERGNSITDDRGE